MAADPSEVVTIRVSRALGRRLAREARRQRKTRSEMARELLDRALTGEAGDPAVEARRQSVLVSRRRSERDALRFVLAAADTSGWK
jgi:predicted transcriptional regulator